MNKLTCLLLGVLPITSHAHPGSSSEAFPLHALQHGGDTVLLWLGLLAIGYWLLAPSRRRS
jgi:hypothetical protein